MFPENETQELKLLLFGQPRLFWLNRVSEPGDTVVPRTSASDSSLNQGEAGGPQPKFLEQPIKIGRRKSLALLAYLAMNNRPFQRQVLMTYFWPDTEPSLAQSYLRRELAVLHRALGDGWLDIDRENIGMIARPDFQLDVIRFRALLARCGTHSHSIGEVCPRCIQILTAAVELYEDDFMAGFNFRDNPNFDEWRFFEGEQLRNDMIGALTRLARGCTAQGDFQRAIDYTRRWLEFSPWDEAAHRDLMQLFLWSGNKAAAMRQFEICLTVLDNDLDQPPEDETVALFEAIKTQTVPPPVLWEPGTEKISSTPDRPTIVESDDLFASLPVRQQMTPAPTAFFGRRPEIAEITHLLSESDCRLVTLVGPGGVGKTSLALKVLEEVKEGFQHGSTIVYLDAIDSAASLLRAIGTAVGFVFSSAASPKLQLLDHLRNKSMLLLLDSFEHLLDNSNPPAGARPTINECTILLREIITVAPRIRLLVTSTERLNLQAEWVQCIQGLPMPSDGLATRQLDEWGEEESAVQLFLHCVAQARSIHELSQADKSAIVRICQAVEGIPLALELAASWAQVISLPEIAAELHQNLSFLSTRMRDLPQRHQSLTALFDRSWRLLGDREQRAISSLAIFRGGFDRNAAAVVTGTDLSLLAALIDKSLLCSDSEGRYRIPEILRVCALAHIEDEDALRTRHAVYFARYLRERTCSLALQSLSPASVEIMQEIDNVRAGWEWAIERCMFAEIKMSLEALHCFYVAQEWTMEGEAAFARALADWPRCSTRAPASPDELEAIRARLLARHGHLAYRLGDYRAAEASLTECLQILSRVDETAEQDTDHRREQAFALRYLGATARKQLDLAQAQRLCESSLELYETLDDRQGTAGTLQQLAILAAQRGAYQKAQSQFRAARMLYERLGDTVGIADTLNNLGVVADRLEDFATARRRHWECLTIRRRIHDRRGISTSLNNLGYLEYGRGHFHLANSFLLECLEIQEELGERDLLGNCLCNLGATATALGEKETAVDYFERAMAIALELETSHSPLIYEILCGLAALYAREPCGNPQLAVRLHAFAAAHSSSDNQPCRFKLREEEVENLLPPSDFQAALTWGQCASLFEVLRLLEHERSTTNDITTASRDWCPSAANRARQLRPFRWGDIQERWPATR